MSITEHCVAQADLTVSRDEYIRALKLGTRTREIRYQSPREIETSITVVEDSRPNPEEGQMPVQVAEAWYVGHKAYGRGIQIFYRVFFENLTSDEAREVRGQ